MLGKRGGEDGAGQPVLAGGAQHAQAVGRGDLDVEEEQVGPQFRDRAEGALAVARLGDDLDVRRIAQQPAQALEGRGFVAHDQGADGFHATERRARNVMVEAAASAPRRARRRFPPGAGAAVEARGSRGPPRRSRTRRPCGRRNGFSALPASLADDGQAIDTKAKSEGQGGGTRARCAQVALLSSGFFHRAGPRGSKPTYSEGFTAAALLPDSSLADWRPRRFRLFYFIQRKPPRREFATRPNPRHP